MKMTAQQKIYQFSGIGMEMATPVILGAALDFWIMKNAFPWFTILGAIVGPVLAFIHLMQVVKAKTVNTPEETKTP